MATEPAIAMPAFFEDTPAPPAATLWISPDTVAAASRLPPAVRLEFSMRVLVPALVSEMLFKVKAPAIAVHPFLDLVQLGRHYLQVQKCIHFLLH